MALRNDHAIMIIQNDHWTTIRLNDRDEESSTVVTGRWKHTSQSHNDEEIKFTSDNPKYLYWEWKGGDPGGILYIGSKMGRASHKAGEEEIFQILITLSGVKRFADGKFKVASSGDEGSGKLKYDVNPHFKAGAITWSVVRYER